MQRANLSSVAVPRDDQLVVAGSEQQRLRPWAVDLLGVGGRGAVGTGTQSNTGNGLIETPYLQLVLTRLWTEELGARSYVLRLETLKRLGGAESIVQEHLNNVMKALGPDDPSVATCLENYADLLRKTGRDAEADKLEVRIKTIRAKTGQ